MNSLYSFIGSFYHSTHSAILLQQPVSFILLFLSKKTSQLKFMQLCKYKYIYMQVCIYVVMFVLPISHNLLQGYFNDEAYQLHQKDPDIVSQKNSLFGAYSKFGQSFPRIMQPYVSWSVLKIFLKIFYNDGSLWVDTVILTIVIFSKNSLVVQLGN